MFNNTVDPSTSLSKDRKKLNKENRARWQAVNYGETDFNLVKYARQVDNYGRIRFW